MHSLEAALNSGLKKGETGNNDEIDREINEITRETVERNYGEVISARDEGYNNDVAADEKRGPMRESLNVHNGIVLDYAIALIKARHLTAEQEVAAITATILHDGGKLNSSLLEHHIAGKERAGAILDKLAKTANGTIDGINISAIREKVLEAIDRHMNHPFLVMLNKGKEFPQPQDEVDEVVFDADMLANIGFKNVGLRLNSPKYLEEDAGKAKANGTSVIEESFKNVMEGVEGMQSTVLSKEAEKICRDTINKATAIFEDMQSKGVFEKYTPKEETDKVIEDPSLVISKCSEIKTSLNQEILKTAGEKGIDESLAKKFIM
ncbi:MAG: hypothetical protein WC752_00655 [Patescibacteria group bacterium]|jgi:hypothetical protein